VELEVIGERAKQLDQHEHRKHVDHEFPVGRIDEPVGQLMVGDHRPERAGRGGEVQDQAGQGGRAA